MKPLVIAVAGFFVLVGTTPASSPISLTPLGTLKTGPLRPDDPRIAEINAYDPTAGASTS
jgi:hypothetical protein